MKRNSLTAIVGKVQVLTINVLCDIDTPIQRKTTYHTMIRKAAVNEIIRLDGEAPESSQLGSAKNGVTPLQEKICGNLKNLQP